VRLLAQQQQADGRWTSGLPDAIEDPVNTTFAVLFLMRSTQKAVDATALGEGLLIGGKGLPGDVRRIRIMDGRVVSEFEQRSAAAIARILSDPASRDFAQLAELEKNLIIESNVASEQDQEQLRRIVQTGSSRARVLAIRALGTQRNLDNVPVLIQALGSNDRPTAQAALQALGRIRRQFDVANLPTSAGSVQRQALVKSWKEWYKSLRPEVPGMEGP
jgi:HEAT repeat protein